MKPTNLFYISVFVAIFFATAAAGPDDSDDDDEVVINRVNKLFGGRQGGWKAERTKFFNKTKKEKRAMLGASLPVPEKISYDVQSAPSTGQKRAVFPASFDARTRWPNCNAIISDVRDQRACGACWAHVTASVVSDRLCITSPSQNLIKKVGVQDLISCMPANYVSEIGANRNLCNGLDVRYAFRMYLNSGIVTGGEYTQTSTGCMPYTSYAGSADISTCPNRCTNTAYPVSYTADKNFGTETLAMGHSFSAWSINGVPLSINKTFAFNSAGQISRQNPTIDTVENNIKQEIMTNGPVTAYFEVYNDFYSYRSGVYTRASTSLLGGHALKIIGWGVEGIVPYWLALNSWGTAWGERGFVKVRRGVNHCKIENYIVSATPRSSGTAVTSATPAPAPSTSSTSLSTRTCTAGSTTTTTYTVPNSMSYLIANFDSRFAIQNVGRVVLMTTLPAGVYVLPIVSFTAEAVRTPQVNVGIYVNCG